jgi:hypothetical protein
MPSTRLDLCAAGPTNLELFAKMVTGPPDGANLSRRWFPGAVLEHRVRDHVAGLLHQLGVSA